MLCHCYHFILLICSTAFLIQMAILWLDYRKGKTNISMSKETHSEKRLPCLTICPLPAFKNTNRSELSLEANMDDYIASTFGRTETFAQKTLHGKADIFYRMTSNQINKMVFTILNKYRLNVVNQIIWFKQFGYVAFSFSCNNLRQTGISIHYKLL